MEPGDRLENLRALRIANLDMAFATMFGALVAGNFYSEFIIRLTPDSRVRAFVFAISALLGILQIPGSLLGQRYKNYKKFVGIGGFFWRFWWLPIAFLPLMPNTWPRFGIFITCVVLQAISIFLINSTYNEWLTKLVPTSHRAWYFSRRAALAVVFGALIGFPASKFMDYMRAQSLTDLGLTITFLTGVALGFVSFYFYCRMPNSERESNAQLDEVHGTKSMTIALDHKPLRRLLWFLAIFTVGQTIAAPFFFPYAREVLHLDLFTIQILGACMAISSISSASLWGYLGEKYGNKPILFLSGVLIFAGPACWALTVPGSNVWNLTILTIGHVCAGIAWTGVNSGQMNFILAITKPEHRAQAMGLTQAVTAVVSGLAPLAAGYWLEGVAGNHPDRNTYMILFIANSIIRLGAVLLLFGIVDPHSTSIRDFLKQLSGVRPKGVLAMKNLQKAETAREKQLAVRSIGESGMTFAESEVMRLLSDPSPRVRRESAAALAKLGARDAAEALVRLIERQPYLVEEEMIDALSSLGDNLAVQPLISLLQNPSSALRRSSARALGRLRSPEALTPLMEAATNPEDAELRRAAIQALRLIGDSVCEPVVSWALQDEYPSVRIAAAEACAELHLMETSPLLRKLLTDSVDETSAEMAYALGVVGNENDLELILQTACAINSGVGRRRCLLACAHLLKVERELYRLMMLDPVSRDQDFLDMANADKSGVVRRAISAYHAGNEAEALQLISKNTSNEKIDLITKLAPRESFLLVIAILQGLH